MFQNVYKRSFRNPVEPRRYADGRHRCDSALRKLFAAGPQRPDSLVKRDTSDAALNAALEKKLSKQERLRRSNSHEALQEIKKVHRAGGRRNLAEAQGEEQFRSKSVEAVRKARGRVVHVGDNRLLSAVELNKAFARDIGKVELGATLDVHGHATGFYPMTKAEKRNMRKGLSNPALNDIGTKPPQSRNGTWNGGIANTGASNDWRDQSEPTLRPTMVGAQTTTTPSQLTRDAAVDAIKFALRKPQKMWGNTKDTADLDEDDEDMDEDDDNAKDPNRDDSRR
jgi:hypothetical protein